MLARRELVAAPIASADPRVAIRQRGKRAAAPRGGLLARSPAQLTAAVEELLRFESPVQYQARRATRQVCVHGVQIPAGARVVLLWGSANRDERRWRRADRLDIAREAKRHLAFGEGIHHCLGAPLARLEGRIVLEQVLAHMPSYRIVGPVERVTTHNTRGVVRLPIEV